MVGLGLVPQFSAKGLTLGKCRVPAQIRAELALVHLHVAQSGHGGLVRSRTSEPACLELGHRRAHTTRRWLSSLSGTQVASQGSPPFPAALGAISALMA